MRGKNGEGRHQRDMTKPRSFKEDKKQGMPKKGGGGGKGTWGRPGDELSVSRTLQEREAEAHDRNTYFETYEHLPTPEEVVELTEPLIVEFLEHGDPAELVDSIKRYRIKRDQKEMIKAAVNLSLDRGNEEREMVSSFLREGCPRIFSKEDVAEAFEDLLTTLPDLVIDIPEASSMLGKFIARAIADQALEASFLDARSKENGKVGEAVGHALAHLKRNRGLELDVIWGAGGGLRPVGVLSEAIQGIIREYFSCNQKDEVPVCLAALKVPHFHHELVYQLVLSAAEKKEREMALALDLLVFLQRNLHLTDHQITQGFERVFSNCSDISLDIPNIYLFLEKFVPHCSESKLITPTLAEAVPTKGKKRLLSQNDGGAIKVA